MNNEFNNQNMNQFQNNNMNNDYSNNYNNLNNQNYKKGNNGLTIALIFIIIVLAGLCLYLFMDKKNDSNFDSKLVYEIKTEVDQNTGAKWHYLYLNNKKVDNIKAYEELGSIEVKEFKEFKDLLIVDEFNPGPSRKLFVVDKDGSASEIDYKVNDNPEFINSIDSYKVEGNNLYIKVNRQWGNGHIDWYCRYEDKNEAAEYEVKYEYVNGKLQNKKVLNEVTIANKYGNEKCNNDNNEGQNENISNKEVNLKNIECSGNENMCTKVFNMNYNGVDHEIKIIQSITSKNDGSPFVCFKEVQIFVDNKMIEKINNISSSNVDNNFDGYAYIFDSKYLGILYPSNQGDYVLNVYDGDSKIGEQKIIWGVQGIYKDEGYKNQLNTLHKIDFDGSNLLFWGDSCYVPLNVGDKFIKVSMKIKNNKINMEAIEYLDKKYGSGATC